MARRDLEDSLERAMRTLDPDLRFTGLEVVARPEVRSILGYVGTGLGIGGAAFAATALATTPWLFIPAGALGLASAVVFGVRSAASYLAQSTNRGDTGSRPAIGLGADVDSSAQLEPGSVVEMGATVRAGSVLRPGALVRMGATIGRDVRIESNAVVGWGATVMDGAVIGEGATIGAGATIKRGAVVEPGTHVHAGATVRATRGKGSRPTEQPAVEEKEAPVEAVKDPRAERIDALCDRLERELSGASEQVRAFLGAPEKTVATLRRTCHDLLTREAGLRREADPETLKRLEADRADLEARIAASDDESVRTSLRGAVAAIDEQHRQRQLLRRNAERLDAELTRLLFTIEGLTSQVVRLRSEGAAAPTSALEESVTRLRDELDALTDAVEAVGRDERDGMIGQVAVGPISPVGSDAGSSTAANRTRERS